MLSTVLLVFACVWTPFAIANVVGMVVHTWRIRHSDTTNWGFVPIAFMLAVYAGPIGSYLWYQDWLANRPND